jgi:hypothetical protein
MIGVLVTWTIISLILIMLSHHLFNFFKDTLTVPKVKDLVQQPTASYKNIEELIAKDDTTPIITKEVDLDTNDMRNELKSFFKELKENTGNNEVASANDFMSASGTQNMFSQL